MLAQLVEREQLDVLCLQETKLPDKLVNRTNLLTGITQAG